MLRQRFIIALLGIGAVAAYPTPSAALTCRPKPPFLQKIVGGSTMCYKVSANTTELVANVASPIINPDNEVQFVVTPQAMKPDADDDERNDDIGPNAQNFKFPRALALCQKKGTFKITARIRRSAVGTFAESGQCDFTDTGPGGLEECTATVVASPFLSEPTIPSYWSAPTPCNSNEKLIAYAPKSLIAEVTFSQSDPGVTIQQQAFCKLKGRLRSLIGYGEGEPPFPFIKHVAYRCTPLP